MRPASNAVDSSSLVVFRIAFGFLVFFNFARHGMTGQLWSTDLPLPFLGWEWLTRPDLAGLMRLTAALCVSGLLIAVGLFFRSALIFFTVGFGHFLLTDEALYQNHYYLMILIAVLLIFTRAGQSFSFDNLLARRTSSDQVPALEYNLLRVQLVVVYFFGGIAKLNPDWLRGEPLRTWLREFYVPGWDLSSLALPMSYGGLLFDLLVAPALIWKKSRPWALLAALVFHSINFYLFRIGVFPFLAMAMSLLFLSANWPRRLGAKLRGQRELPSPEEIPWCTTPAVVIWAVVQIALPLRHLVYPGDVCWNMEGQKFSWMMKLHTRTGSGRFLVNTEKEVVEVDPYDRLSPFTAGQVLVLPENLVKYARRLRKEFEHRGVEVKSITADVKLKLNAHPPRPYVDPDVDLSRVQLRPLQHASWILPGPHD